MRPLPPIELLNLAAEALGELSRQVVFLGGAVVGLLVTEKGGLPLRITTDVDVAIEVGSSILDVHALDRQLLHLGFTNDMDGPVCRYLQGSLILDVIPVQPAFPGSINSWYPLALDSAWLCELGNGIQVRVIDPVCFLGTKMEAFRSSSRVHNNDIFLSRDFEDIVRVIDGRSTIVGEVARANKSLSSYLAEQIRVTLDQGYLEEALQFYVESGRERVVLERMRAIAEISSLG